MTLFYDPKSRKPKLWAVILLIILPVVLTVATLAILKRIADNKKVESQAQQKGDIF